MEEEKKEAVNKFADPLEIMKEIDVKRGDVMADFGCGAGYFSLPFAKLVGEEGKVYAFDVLASSLESVESEAKVGGLSNVVTKRVNLEAEKGSGLDDEIVNWVVMKNILFQNKNKEGIIGEAYRILKKGGRVLIMEWNDNNSSLGPDPKLRISEEELELMVNKNNFTVEKKVKVGDFHYMLIAVK
ncbi:MAG: methyltransferase domain-containing protein [Candidatus Moranbacteria bacterium]|nr:methyltransferase domain-containing protein [Candidatus Moranbacteria bacterium]